MYIGQTQIGMPVKHPAHFNSHPQATVKSPADVASKEIVAGFFKAGERARFLHPALALF